MIFDKQNVLSEHQAITATAVSEHSIDLLKTGAPAGVDWAVPAFGPSPVSDIGRGGRKNVYCQVTENFNALTSLAFELVGSDTVDANGKVNGTIKVYQTVTVPINDLKAGKQVNFVLQPGMDKRYLALRYTVTGTNPTAGKIYAGVVHDYQTQII